MQKMTRCDGVDTIVDGSQMIFHWFMRSEAPAKGMGSPLDGHLRRYSRRCVRFATQHIRDLALITFDLTTLADVAMACWNNSLDSTRYWLELLAVKYLQVQADTFTRVDHFINIKL